MRRRTARTNGARISDSLTRIAFTRSFDWINGSNSYYPASTEEMVAVQPGDRVNASLVWVPGAAAYKMSVESARGSKSVTLKVEPGQSYTRLFFVIEHQVRARARAHSTPSAVCALSTRAFAPPDPRASSAPAARHVRRVPGRGQPHLRADRG